MSGPDLNGYLMVFADGPMAKVGNIGTLASNLAGGAVDGGKMVVKRDLFGWPLPEKLCVLAHPGVASNVAMWGEGEETDLPPEITDSPNAVTYEKVRQSELPDDTLSHVMRGAEYKLVGER